MAALVATQRIVNSRLASAVKKNVLGQDMDVHVQPQSALTTGTAHAGT
jgi:hypothetical protein